MGKYQLELEEKADLILNDLILNIIENTLLDIFGKKSLNSILLIMKKNYSLEWKDIPNRIEVFAKALHKIIGKGSVIIENLIIEKLYLKLDLTFKWKKGYKSSDYIKELKKWFKETQRFNDRRP